MASDIERITIDQQGDLVLRMRHYQSFKTTQIRVCSSAMRRATTTWKNICNTRPFQPGSFVTVDFGIEPMVIDDLNVKALVQVLHMVHGNHRAVGIKPTMEELYRIFGIVQTYNLYEAVIPYSTAWADQIRRLMSKASSTTALDAFYTVHAMWELGLAGDAIFLKTMTKLVLHGYPNDDAKIIWPITLSEVTLSSWDEYKFVHSQAIENQRARRPEPGMEFWVPQNATNLRPERLGEVLNERRFNTIRRILQFVKDQLAPLKSDQAIGCKYGHKPCDRQVLGNMWSRMEATRGGLLPDPENTCFVDESVATLLMEVGHIFGPGMNLYHDQCSPHHNWVEFHKTLSEEMNDWTDQNWDYEASAQYRKTHLQS
ncbi:hypothetical protein V8F20_011572 [Naviculisporaceae sp. PSN 640]